MTPAPPDLLPDEQTFDAAYGLRVTDLSPELARAELDVEDRVRQPLGLLHGGVYAAAAEALCARATQAVVGPAGHVAIGRSTITNFLRPVTEGTVRAEAVPRHRGRTTWLWDVTFTTPAGKTSAVTRVVLQITDAGAILTR